MEESCIPARLHFEYYVPDNYDPDLNPLIFVHGIGDSCETWTNILKKVAEETKRKAYGIDLRNHGKSEWSESFSSESLCLDIENFMVKNGIKKTIFVSHSLGGRVCMNICLRKPELVEKIVIEDARLQDMSPREMEALTVVSNLIRGLNFFSKTMKEKEMRNFLAKRVKELYPNNYDLEMFAYYLPGHQDAEGNFQASFNLQAVARSLQDKSLLILDYAQFQPYSGPALIIYGTKSILKTINMWVWMALSLGGRQMGERYGIVRKKSLLLRMINLEENLYRGRTNALYPSGDTDELLQKYFPNAEYHRVENSSHYVHKEYSKEFTTKVCEFLNS